MKGFTKILALVLACLMMVSLLVACGGGAPAQDNKVYNLAVVNHDASTINLLL